MHFLKWMHLYSFDLVKEDTHNLYHHAFLNSISPIGLPPHKLLLKIGAAIMLLRNIDLKNGLCNDNYYILDFEGMLLTLRYWRVTLWVHGISCHVFIKAVYKLESSIFNDMEAVFHKFEIATNDKLTAGANDSLCWSLFVRTCF